MQPNQQMNMANTEAAPVPGMSAAGMPETAGAGAAPAPVAETPKKSHNMLMGMIALGVVALCGVVFGVAAMAAKGSEAASYEKQITQLKEMVEEQAEDTTESVIVTVPDGEEVELDGGKVADTSKYIYVGDWGMKIKIPENLFSVSYSFHQAAGYTVLYVSGVSNGGQYFPRFADMLYNYGGMVAVARYPVGFVSVGETPSLGTLVFSDDEYEYYYSPAQMVYSTDEDEKTWEVESAQLIGEMLGNFDNYSAI